MPTLGERWQAFRRAMAAQAAKRSWSGLLARSREAIAAATAPTRAFLEAERARFEAARRRQQARDGEMVRDEAESPADDDSPRGGPAPR